MVDVGSGRFVAVGITCVDFFVGVGAIARFLVLTGVGLVSRVAVNATLQPIMKNVKSIKMAIEKDSLKHFGLIIIFYHPT